MIRTQQQWIEILAPLSPKQAGRRILGDLISYRNYTEHEDEDAAQLAAALDAWRVVGLSK